jgi:hypothetical protein
MPDGDEWGWNREGSGDAGELPPWLYELVKDCKAASPTAARHALDAAVTRRMFGLLAA